MAGPVIWGHGPVICNSRPIIVHIGHGLVCIHGLCINGNGGVPLPHPLLLLGHSIHVVHYGGQFPRDGPLTERALQFLPIGGWCGKGVGFTFVESWMGKRQKSVEALKYLGHFGKQNTSYWHILNLYMGVGFKLGHY